MTFTHWKRLTGGLLALGLMGLAACGGEDGATPADDALSIDDSDRVKTDPGKADSSAEAVFLNFTFQGEMVTSQTWNLDNAIEEQLLYTVGELNGEAAISRLDGLDLTNIETSSEGNGLTKITYDATMVVAWSKNRVPHSYTFVLPRDVSYSGNKAFTEKYGHACVEWGAHDVDVNTMWYYYRPNNRACDLADEDVVKIKAEISVSDIATTGKYPEYHQVWKDDELKVVAVFGKYEDDATSSSDAGISAYNAFVKDISRELSQHGLTTVPEEVKEAPGVDQPDTTFRAKIDDTHSVTVVALLIDSVRSAGSDFNSRYEELSRDADIIVYNGHSGLGANIRALATKGDWTTGQYSIVFMNGCDTYAYVDSALADAHAAVNDDDPNGSKYLDLVMNAMPSPFRSMSRATMALVRGLMKYEEPRTYERIFGDVDSSQVILVSGEQDNVYVPGYDPDAPAEIEVWEGMHEAGAVTKNEENHYETPTLEAGTYVFEMTGSGDADLYVRVGSAPTLTEYECRPYRYNSNESCAITLASPASIFVMVRGYKDAEYDLGGFPNKD